MIGPMKQMKVRLFALLVVLAIPALAEVKVARDGERIDVSVDGKPFTSFFFGSDSPKPYLHPLRSASGIIVTRSWPMQSDVAGESKDHPHHRGLFFAHGEVNGTDFWSEGKDKGHIVFSSLGEAKGGKDSGVITAKFNWVSPDGKNVLEESRRMTFREVAGQRYIDFELTLKAGRDKVTLGDTKEGTFAIRVVKSLEEKTPKCAPCTGVMSSSEGSRGETQIWGKRATWVDYSGTVENEPLGITIFDHPQNPKHPAYWHARAYGLFAVNQFGEHDYYNDKTRNGSVTIEPEKSITFRYRVVIHPGDAAQAQIAAQYAKWAGK